MDFAAPDKASALKAYIGGRIADGDRPADVLADIQSADFFQKAGDTPAYRAALDQVAPNKLNGKALKRAEQLAPMFEKYADDYVGALGGHASTMNRQQIDAGPVSQEALHRALSDEPAGKVAYKPIGELSTGDARALREIVTSPLESMDDSGFAWFLKQQQAAKAQAGLF